MKNPTHCILNIPSPDISKSIAFFQELGFETQQAGKQFLVADAQCQFLIDPAPSARAGWTFYLEDWNILFENDFPKKELKKFGDDFVISDGNGVYLRFSKSQMPAWEGSSPTRPSLLGSYAGVSQEVFDLQASLDFYAKWGFKVEQGGSTQGWASLRHSNGQGLSLMAYGSCPHLFFNPSLTYFNGKNNLAVIESLRESGIPLAQEITHFNDKGIVDNVILQDAGGLGIFVFSD
jgi:catechol 2,3-dioxygenase-like lactoylglutathione lyase family enzyme